VIPFVAPLGHNEAATRGRPKCFATRKTKNAITLFFYYQYEPNSETGPHAKPGIEKPGSDIIRTR